MVKPTLESADARQAFLSRFMQRHYPGSLPSTPKKKTHRRSSSSLSLSHTFIPPLDPSQTISTSSGSAATQSGARQSPAKDRKSDFVGRDIHHITPGPSSSSSGSESGCIRTSKSSRRRSSFAENAPYSLPKTPIARGRGIYSTDKTQHRGTSRESTPSLESDHSDVDSSMDFEDHSTLTSPIASNENDSASVIGIPPHFSMADLHLFEQYVIDSQLPPISEEQIEEMFQTYINMDACASPKYDTTPLAQ